MLEVIVKGNAIYIGKDLSVTFQRTLPIPDDDQTYPLPPELGEFPICKVDDYANKVPVPRVRLKSRVICISSTKTFYR